MIGNMKTLILSFLMTNVLHPQVIAWYESRPTVTVANNARFVEDISLRFVCHSRKIYSNVMAVWFVRDSITRKKLFYSNTVYKKTLPRAFDKSGVNSFSLMMRRDFSGAEVVCQDSDGQEGHFLLPAIKKTIPLKVTFITENLVRGQKLRMFCDVEGDLSIVKEVWFRTSSQMLKATAYRVLDATRSSFELKTDAVISEEHQNIVMQCVAITKDIKEDVGNAVSPLVTVIVHHFDFVTDIWRYQPFVRGEYTQMKVTVNAYPYPEDSNFHLEVIGTFSGIKNIQKLQTTDVRLPKREEIFNQDFPVQLRFQPQFDGIYRVVYNSSLLQSFSNSFRIYLFYFDFPKMSNHDVLKGAPLRFSFLARANPKPTTAQLSVLQGTDCSAGKFEVEYVTDDVKFTSEVLREDVFNISVEFVPQTSNCFHIVFTSTQLENKSASFHVGIHYASFAYFGQDHFSVRKGENLKLSLLLKSCHQPQEQNFMLHYMADEANNSTSVNAFSSISRNVKIIDMKAKNHSFKIDVKFSPQTPGIFKLIYQSSPLLKATSPPIYVDVHYLRHVEKKWPKIAIYDGAEKELSFIVQAEPFPERERFFVYYVSDQMTKRITANIRVSLIQRNLYNVSVTFKPFSGSFRLRFISNSFTADSGKIEFKTINLIVSAPMSGKELKLIKGHATAIVFKVSALVAPHRHKINVHRIASDGEVLEAVGIQSMTQITAAGKRFFRIEMTISPSRSGDYSALLKTDNVIVFSPKFRIRFDEETNYFRFVGSLLLLLPLLFIGIFGFCFLRPPKISTKADEAQFFLEVSSDIDTDGPTLHHVSPLHTLNNLLRSALPVQLHQKIRSVTINDQIYEGEELQSIRQRTLESLSVDDRSTVSVRILIDPNELHAVVQDPLSPLASVDRTLRINSNSSDSWLQFLKKELHLDDDIVAYQWGIFRSASASDRLAVLSYDVTFGKFVFADEDSGVCVPRGKCSSLYRRFLTVGSSIRWAPLQAPVIEIFQRSYFLRNDLQRRHQKVEIDEICSGKWLLMLQGYCVTDAEDQWQILAVKLVKGLCVCDSGLIFHDEYDYKESLGDERQNLRQFFLLLADGDPLPKWNIPRDAMLEIYCRQGITIKMENGKLFRKDGDVNSSFSDWIAAINSFFSKDFMKEMSKRRKERPKHMAFGLEYDIHEMNDPSIVTRRSMTL